MRQIEEDLEMWMKLMPEPTFSSLNPEMVLVKDFTEPLKDESQLDIEYLEKNFPKNYTSTSQSSEAIKASIQISKLQQDNAQEILSTKKINNKCSCKKSYCLKSYCQCYASGGSCSSQCGCLSCENKENSPRKHEKLIKKASRKNSNGCTCKKSKCLKKYCECYNSGKQCGIYCKCEGCQNSFGVHNKQVKQSIGSQKIQFSQLSRQMFLSLQ